MAAPGGYKRLGDWLIDKGLLSEQELALALNESKGTRLGETLELMGLVDQDALVAALADQYGLEVENLAEANPSKSTLSLIPSSFALSHLTLPLEDLDDFVRVCIFDPLDVTLTDHLQKRMGKRIELSLAPSRELYEAIVKHYRLPFRTRPSKSKKRPIDNQADRRELLDALHFAQNEAA